MGSIQEQFLQILQSRGDDAEFTANIATLGRDALLQTLLGDDKDIDKECGYPKDITSEQYRRMFDRNGVAERVVNLFPEETWAQDPIVAESDDADETEFEAALKEVGKNLSGQSWQKADEEEGNPVWAHLLDGDILSGIGRYGVVLYGFGDGKNLNEPVDGVDDHDMKIDREKKEPLQLLYMQQFDESMIDIDSVVDDSSSRRHGLPKFYNIKMGSEDSVKESVKVHWSRILHLAEGNRSHRWMGTPRQQTLYNRLYDIRKVSGGSSEMFWKGGFPGYSFEVNPSLGDDLELDKDAMRKEFDDYSKGLKRYLALTGVSAKSLAPQVADPESHVMISLKLICIGLRCPLRVFMGTEQGVLAGDQDSKAWNKRVRRRQTKHNTPNIVVPFLDRMIKVGVLPEPPEGYSVNWPDMHAPSDKDKVEVGKSRTEAMAKYVMAGVNELMDPEDFLTKVLGFSDEEARMIQEKADAFIQSEANASKFEDDDDDEE